MQFVPNYCALQVVASLQAQLEQRKKEAEQRDLLFQSLSQETENLKNQLSTVSARCKSLETQATVGWTHNSTTPVWEKVGASVYIQECIFKMAYCAAPFILSIQFKGNFCKSEFKSVDVIPHLSTRWHRVTSVLTPEPFTKCLHCSYKEKGLVYKICAFPKKRPVSLHLHLLLVRLKVRK